MLHAPTSSDPPVSAWTPAAEPLPVTRPLEGDRRADVVIVGAGLAGSECAWQLARRGHRVRLYEMRPALAAAVVLVSALR